MIAEELRGALVENGLGDTLKPILHYAFSLFCVGFEAQCKFTCNANNSTFITLCFFSLKIGGFGVLFGDYEKYF